MLVDDPDIRRELAGIYVAAMDDFVNRPAGVTNPTLTRLLLDAVVKF